MAPSRITMVPYPLTIRRRGTERGDERARTVGVVCRLEPQKRVDQLIDVVAELGGRGVACSGLVVGGGSQLPLLTEHARRLGVEDIVEFAGEQDDVVPWLDRIDVFLMTSSSEPFGIAGLEAIARGVPLVAMPCPGGLPELAELGGTLLPDRAIGTAADAVALLLSSTDARGLSRARGDAVVAEHDPRTRRRGAGARLRGWLAVQPSSAADAAAGSSPSANASSISGRRSRMPKRTSNAAHSSSAARSSSTGGSRAGATASN